MVEEDSRRKEGRLSEAAPGEEQAALTHTKQVVGVGVGGCCWWW